MNREIKVSILVPSLNVSNYIKECLDSIVEQSLRDIEILCIDAGSTDGTIEIIRDIMKGDDRVRLIISEKKSYGYQLNQGIQIACGEYIGIVESDDYVKHSAYEQLYKCATDNNAEVVKSDFEVFFDTENDGRVFQKVSHAESGGKYGGPFSKEDYIKGSQETDTFIWNAIYKRSYLNKENIIFNESAGAAYQDCGFRYQIFASVHYLYYLDEAFYCYRRDNPGSSMYSEKAFSYNFEECKYIANMLPDKETVLATRAFLSEKIMATLLNSYRECLFCGAETTMLNNQLKESRKWILEQLGCSRMIFDDKSGTCYCKESEFISDIDGYIDACINDSQNRREKYRLFFEKVAGYKRCIIFGAGKYGRAAYLVLYRNRMVEQVSVCDNDDSLWGQNLYNTEISSPAFALDSYDEMNDCFVVASGRYSENIMSQLEESGISRSRIIKYALDVYPLLCTGNLFDVIVGFKKA